MVEEPACCCGGASSATECCGGTASPISATSTADAHRKFMNFMGEVMSEGAIPVRTKELMAISLSILAKCEPCVKIHIDKARALGISRQEIDEAIWMAISFGGAPTMMFYNSIK